MAGRPRAGGRSSRDLARAAAPGRDPLLGLRRPHPGGGALVGRDHRQLRDALILAVNLADDADTVGAVTGQLAGALYGASAIPGRWLRPLAWRDRIETLAERLAAAPAALVTNGGPRRDGQPATREETR